MIVKDEEAMLGAHARGRPPRRRRDHRRRHRLDRPHRRDRAEHGARVLHHEWDGDFAAARNVSFDAATGDWVMYLDADEVLVVEDAQRLRALTGRTWREAFYLVETNHTGELGDGTAVTHNALRVFRNRPEYRFEGRIHEQIAHNLPGYLPERLEHTAVRVEHFGYLGAVRDAKDKVKPQPRAAASASRPRASTRRSCTSTSARSTPRSATPDAPSTHFERAWNDRRTDRTPPPTASSRR